jgi:chitosanase
MSTFFCWIKYNRLKSLISSIQPSFLGSVLTCITLFSLYANAQFVNDFKLNETEVKIAEQLVSIFENSTPKIQYNYAEKLEDWKIRGITFGRSGFTTCQDGVEVFTELKKIEPHHALLKFSSHIIDLPENSRYCVPLTRILMKYKFVEAFNAHGNDPSLVRAQNIVYQRRYFNQALVLMKRMNLNKFFSFVVILDTIIQHGQSYGQKTNGPTFILNIANLDVTTLNGMRVLFSPNGQAELSEYHWLLEFLDRRKMVLAHGDDEWKKSVSRPDELKKIVMKYFYAPHDKIEFRSIEYGNFNLPIN